MYDVPYMQNLKRNDTNELTKQKEAHRLRERTYLQSTDRLTDLENKPMVTKGERREGKIN